MYSRTTNDPCTAELGRLPLWKRIHFLSTKFWNHIITYENTPVFKIYIATVNTNSWKRSIFSIINSLGLSFIIDKGSSIKPLLSLLTD